MKAEILRTLIIYTILIIQGIKWLKYYIKISKKPNINRRDNERR